MVDIIIMITILILLLIIIISVIIALEYKQAWLRLESESIFSISKCDFIRLANQHGTE